MKSHLYGIYVRDTDANSYPHSQHVQTTPLDEDGCGLKSKPTINAVTNCDTPDRLETHGGLGSGQGQYGGPRVAVSLSLEQVPIGDRVRWRESAPSVSDLCNGV